MVTQIIQKKYYACKNYQEKEKEKTPFKSTVSMILQVHLMDQLN